MDGRQPLQCLLLPMPWQALSSLASDCTFPWCCLPSPLLSWLTFCLGLGSGNRLLHAWLEGGCRGRQCQLSLLLLCLLLLLLLLQQLLLLLSLLLRCCLWL